MNCDLIMRRAAGLIEQGKVEECFTFLHSHLATYRGQKNIGGVGTILCALAELHVEAGDPGGARPLLMELLAIECDDLLEVEQSRGRELLMQIGDTTGGDALG